MNQKQISHFVTALEFIKIVCKEYRGLGVNKEVSRNEVYPGLSQGTGVINLDPYILNLKAYPGKNEEPFEFFHHDDIQGTNIDMTKVTSRCFEFGVKWLEGIEMFVTYLRHYFLLLELIPSEDIVDIEDSAHAGAIDVVKRLCFTSINNSNLVLSRAEKSAASYMNKHYNQPKYVVLAPNLISDYMNDRLNLQELNKISSSFVVENICSDSDIVSVLEKLHQDDGEHCYLILAREWELCKDFITACDGICNIGNKTVVALKRGSYDAVTCTLTPICEVNALLSL